MAELYRQEKVKKSNQSFLDYLSFTWFYWIDCSSHCSTVINGYSGGNANDLKQAHILVHHWSIGIWVDYCSCK